MHTVILKPGKEASVMRRHPWIFSGAVRSITGKVEEGDLVEVTDHNRHFLGIGHYQPGTIAVRLLTFKPERIDSSFWEQRIRDAWALREKTGLAGSRRTNMFRLVHGEGDRMPGIIIDLYGKTAVVQVHTVGMLRSLPAILPALQGLPGKRLAAVYDRSSHTLPGRAREGYRDSYLAGGPGQDELRENGLRFAVDWEQGQKTGFFLDQRENRSLLESYASDRKVLNVFGYTGGFSVYALRGGAREVHTVDSSAPALEGAERNVGLNGMDTGRHRAIQADAMDYLRKMDRDYDLVVLDPPAYAKHGEALNNALQGYRRLNQAALEKIRPGGILFTFSCSQVVSRENFRKSVFVAATTAGREVRILHQLSQPPDHPISIYHP